MKTPPCKPGDRIRLVKMGEDDPCPMEPGSTGTVVGVESGFVRSGVQIMVSWDPHVQRTLHLVWPHDEIEVIETVSA